MKLIFVVGEEVRKNREGISEARTEHSIVAGIETNLNLIWVQQKNIKPTSILLLFWNSIILSPNEIEIEIYLWLRFEGSSTRNGHCRARSKHLDGKNQDCRKPTRWSVEERPDRGIREKRLPTKQQTDGDAKRWLGKQMRYLTKDKHHLEFQGKLSRHLWQSLLVRINYRLRTKADLIWFQFDCRNRKHLRISALLLQLDWWYCWRKTVFSI